MRLSIHRHLLSIRSLDDPSGSFPIQSTIVSSMLQVLQKLVLPAHHTSQSSHRKRYVQRQTAPNTYCHKLTRSFKVKAFRVFRKYVDVSFNIFFIKCIYISIENSFKNLFFFFCSWYICCFFDCIARDKLKPFFYHRLHDQSHHTHSTLHRHRLNRFG